jgi:hypothetical protein
MSFERAASWLMVVGIKASLHGIGRAASNSDLWIYCLFKNLSTLAPGFGAKTKLVGLLSRIENGLACQSQERTRDMAHESRTWLKVFKSVPLIEVRKCFWGPKTWVLTGSFWHAFRNTTCQQQVQQPAPKSEIRL